LTGAPGQSAGIEWRKLAWFAYFCSLAVWALCAYFYLPEMLAEGRLFTTTIDKRICVSDFVAFYNGSVLARDCTASGINIYDPAVQAESLARIIAPVKAESSLALQYPPWFFALLTPLSLVDLKTAWYCWSLLGLAVFVAALCYLASGLTTRFEKAFFVVAALASFPAWFTVKLGQTSLFLFAIFTAFWCLLRGGRLFWSGVCAGLLLIKLQYAPLAVIAGLAAGRLRFVSGLAVSGALLLALSFFAVGWDNLLRFPAALVGGEMAGTTAGLSPEMMQNFRGALVLAGFGDTSAVKLLSSAALLVVAGAVLFAWLSFSKRARRPEEFEVMAGITTLLILIFSLHTHMQDYVLVALPAVWLWPARWRAKGARAAWLSRLLVFFPCLSWLFFLLTVLFLYVRVQPFFILSFAILSLSLLLYRQCHKRLDADGV
jgi:hypothetical protein